MTDSPTPVHEPVILTEAGLERLKAEIQGLREIKRPELLARLQRFSLFMDPAQGAALADVARSDLETLDRLIAENEATLAKAQVAPEPPKDTVELGSTVTLRYDDGTEETLTVVGPFEAELTGGTVATTSPVGQALLGKTPGADITVGSGDDSVSMKVVAVGKADASVEPVADTEGV